jgi:FtsH-binding integral membrane protein
MNQYRDDYYDDDDYQGGVAAIAAPLSERAAFLSRTYLHLTGAVLVFSAILGFALNTKAGEQLALAIGSNWLIALIAFMIVSYVARKWAVSSTNIGTQYIGLALFTVAEAIIFIPLLYMADRMGGDIIPAAGIITLVTFGGLTAIVMVTKADFSFLRGTLWACSLGASALILCSIIFGFSLGIMFAALMIVVFAGWILYDTSEILHNYPTNMHVAASLALFASLAMLFWYVVRLLMLFGSDD